MTKIDHEIDLQTVLRRLGSGMDTQLAELRLAEDPRFPAHSDLTGVYHMTDSYDPNQWSGFPYIGFLAGRLWLLSAALEEPRYADAAERLCRRIEPVLSRGPVLHENAGFDVFYALAMGYNTTADEWYKGAALRALENFAQLYQPDLGVFLCNADSDEVVIDTACALVGFMWGSKFEPEYGRLVKTHLDTIIELGLLAPTGEAFQGVQFDLTDRSVKRHFARQGYQEQSHWTRAQAWAIHNYLNSYETFRDESHLALSVKAAHWFWERLPEGLVPFYDYDDPRVPEIPLDTCSSLLAANAFLRFEHMPGVIDAAEWGRRGRAILSAIISDHMTLSGTVLHGSWGNARNTRNLGRFPQEDIMCYGNYWIVESVYRAAVTDWRVPSLLPVSA